MSQLLVPPPPPLPSTANASHGKLDFFTPSKKTPFSDVTNGQAPQRALATGAKRIPAPQVTMKGGLGHGMGELPEHLRSVGDKDKEKNHYMKPTEAFKHALEDPSVTPNRPKKSVVPTAKVAQASPARVRPSLASKAVREDASVRSNHSKVVVPSITKIMDNAPKRVMPIVEQHLQTPTRPTVSNFFLFHFFKNCQNSINVFRFFSLLFAIYSLH